MFIKLRKIACINKVEASACGSESSSTFQNIPRPRQFPAVELGATWGSLSENEKGPRTVWWQGHSLEQLVGLDPQSTMATN